MSSFSTSENFLIDLSAVGLVVIINCNLLFIKLAVTSLIFISIWYRIFSHSSYTGWLAPDTEVSPQFGCLDKEEERRKKKMKEEKEGERTRFI